MIYETAVKRIKRKGKKLKRWEKVYDFREKIRIQKSFSIRLFNLSSR